MLSRTSVWRHFDLWLMAAVFILIAYGILMIHSAITGAPEFEGLDARQAQFAAIGFGLMLIVAAVDYRYLTALHWYLYLAFIGSLIYVAIAGAIGNQVQLWIQITSTIRIQPTEFGRIIIAITFAQFLAMHWQEINRFSNTIRCLIYIGVPLVFIFLQPDLGMTIMFGVVWFAMIWMAGLPLSHFVVLAVSGVAGIIAIYPFLAEYQKLRLLSFVTPNAESEIVRDQVFNVEQALISVGSGGWWGKGYMQGTQSQSGFLRVQHTDFIFSMLTEEMGFFFGALVVLGLLGFIMWRILQTAMLTPDPVGKLICVGIAGTFFFQTIVTVGMNLRLLPVTGLTLPFVSYGGSSLWSLMVAIGVVQSVRMRHRKQEFG
ncbi:MAG: rod shape-determining protein RodA [Anaerolineae bacterium]|nr:rod shape-determining protein RodA [Anaerolineae bacterium]